MADVQQTYRFKFEFDRKDVKKQLKDISIDVKDAIAQMGDASDKVTIFKDLISYLSNVDKALDAFKTKHKNDFSNLFGNPDVDMTKLLEDVFGTTQKAAQGFATLKDRISEAASSNADLRTLRGIAEEVNDLFVSIGKTPPISVDEMFTGKGSKKAGTDFAGRINLLNDTLAEFGATYEGLQNRLKNGFSFGGTGGGKSDPTTSSMQGIIDKLHEQNSELKEAQKQLKSTISDFKQKDNISDKYKIDVSEESVRGLISEYDMLEDSLKSADKSSASYYNTLTKLLEVSLKLKRAFKEVEENDELHNAFVDASGGRGNSTLNGLLSHYALNKSPVSKDAYNTVNNKVLDKTIQNNNDLIDELNAGNDINAVIQKRIDLYDELKAKASEYQRLLLAEYTSEKEEDAILERQEKIENSIQKLVGVKGAQGLESIQLVLEKLADDGQTVDNVLQNLYTTLGMELPDSFKARIESLVSQVKVVENVSQGGMGSGSGVGEKLVSSVDRAKESLQEFLALTDEIQNKSFSFMDASGNVEIGKYTERLEAAKNALREFGDAGVLTAHDMEKVEVAFQEAQDRLSMYTTSYDSHGGGYSYTYYDEYQGAREEAINLSEENERLRQEIEEERSKQKTGSGLQGPTTSDEELEDIRRENGTLEDKLELLREIAEQYASNITQKKRDRYEDLNQKDMNDGLSSSQEERFWELGEEIMEADEALEEFGNAYDRIILKLANGKKIEILPDDAGLRKFYKFVDESFGADYGGVEIDDVIFERKQEQAIIQQTNQELEEQLSLQRQIGAEEDKQDHKTNIDESNEYKAEADAIEHRNEVLKEGNVLKVQEDDLNHQNISGTGTLVDTDVYKGDINAEIQQLENLKAILLEVEQAVQLKTQAFRDEGIAVEQTVSREVEVLRELLVALGYIKSAADTINDIFTQNGNSRALSSGTLSLTSGAASNSYALESTLQTTNGILKTISDKLNGNESLTEFVTPLNNAVAELKNAASSVAEQRKHSQQDSVSGNSKPKNNFSNDLSAQKSAFSKYRKELLSVDYLTEDVRKKIDRLAISLNNVEDKAGLKKWKENFADIREEVSVLQGAFEKLGAANVRKINGVLNNELKGLDFNSSSSNITAEQQEILDLRSKLVQQLEEYSVSVKNGKQVELNSINETVNALKEKINAYKTANDLVNAGGKSGKTFGATATINATAKFNSLKQQVTGVGSEFANSAVVQQAFKDYEAAYDRLIAKRKELAQLDNLNDSQIAGFKQLQTECNNYAKALNKIITDSQKLNANAANDQPWMLGGDFADTNEGRKAALADFVQEMYGVSVAAENFKNNWNEVVFAVDNGDGTFTQMSATFNAAKTQIVALAGDTKKATGALEVFFNELKGKFKSVASYAMASISIYDFIRVIKQGVTYVKEIDSALTELKKVTDETEESYANFLKTASKTASEIGSNVADFTNATADFARLGYDVEQASELAKAASVYKNVGDGIDDIATASESIISTMKAYGIEAENTMGIVDRFNEVGNNFAISSTGIGEALQRSASALYAGGNTIDESIALVTAANSVVILVPRRHSNMAT